MQFAVNSCAVVWEFPRDVCPQHLQLKTDPPNDSLCSESSAQFHICSSRSPMSRPTEMSRQRRARAESARHFAVREVLPRAVAFSSTAFLKQGNINFPQRIFKCQTFLLPTAWTRRFPRRPSTFPTPRRCCGIYSQRRFILRCFPTSSIERKKS